MICLQNMAVSFIKIIIRRTNYLHHYCRVFCSLYKLVTCWWGIFRGLCWGSISLSRGICGVGDSQNRWRDWNVQCNTSGIQLLLFTLWWTGIQLLFTLSWILSRKWIVILYTLQKWWVRHETVAQTHRYEVQWSTIHLYFQSPRVWHYQHHRLNNNIYSR